MADAYLTAITSIGRMSGSCASRSARDVSRPLPRPRSVAHAVPRGLSAHHRRADPAAARARRARTRARRRHCAGHRGSVAGLAGAHPRVPSSDRKRHPVLDGHTRADPAPVGAPSE
jgi:hypothetical protein